MTTPSNEVACLTNVAAAELGDSEIGSEHLLLAMLHPESDSAASEALRASGLTYRAVLEDVSKLSGRGSTRVEISPSPGDGRLLNAEAIRVQGRAEGFAGGLGSSVVDSEHLLLAILWDAKSLASTMVERHGAMRRSILEELGRLGVNVSAVRFPRRPRWSSWRPVSAEDFERLTSELRDAGTYYRFRSKKDSVFISVAEGATADSADTPSYPP